MSELTVPITTDDHSQGEVDAKCTLVEYGDYQCSYCGQAAPVIRRLQDYFGTDMRFVFRNFPLRELHPNAVHAAEAAEFAAANGKFWEMHDLLYQNQSSLEDDALLAFAVRLDLTGDKLGEVLRLEAYLPRIKSDFSGGVRSGVNGTPTFFLNGWRHDGEFDYETLADAVQQQIEANHVGPSQKKVSHANN